MAGESVADFCLSYVSRRTKKFTRATKRNNGRGVVLVVFHTRGVHSRVDPNDPPELKDAHFMFLDSLLQSGSEELVHAAQNYTIGSHFVVWIVCESTMTQEPYVSRVYTLPTADRDGASHSPTLDAAQGQYQAAPNTATVVVAPVISPNPAYLVQQPVGFPPQLAFAQPQQPQQGQGQKPPASLPIQDVSDFSASWRSRMLDLLQGTSQKAEAEALQLQPNALLQVAAPAGGAPAGPFTIPVGMPMGMPAGLPPMQGGMQPPAFPPGMQAPFQPMYQGAMPMNYSSPPMGHGASHGPQHPGGWDLGDGMGARGPHRVNDTAAKEFWDVPYNDRSRSANRLLEFEEEVDPVESWSAIAAHFRSGARKEKEDAPRKNTEQGGITQLRTEASALRSSLNSLVSRFDDINGRSPDRPKSIEEIMNSLDNKLKQTDASLFDSASPVKSGNMSQSPQRDLIQSDNATSRARRLEGESLRNELAGQMESLKNGLANTLARADNLSRSPQASREMHSNQDQGTRPPFRLSSDPGQPTALQLQQELEDLKQTMNRRVEEEVERRMRLLRREWEGWVQTLGQRMEQKMEQMIRMNT